MSSSWRRRLPIVALFAALVAGATVIRYHSQEIVLRALPYGFKKFNLSDPPPECADRKDHMPAVRDPVAYHLYIEARKIWRSKIGWQLTRDEAMKILKDVRSAADQGDWGARALLAHFYLYGLGILESNHVLDAVPEKAVEIARTAAEARQPWGTFDLGVAYEHGYGGVVADHELAWAYYLRAAELGSPDAQMALASAYGEAGRPRDQELMLQCAYRQGHAPAAYELALQAKAEKRYMDAIKLCQEGVKFGSKRCAASLELLFLRGFSFGATEEEKSELQQRGIEVDAERMSRYKMIYDALTINPDLTLPHLDNVLPLPPAELPSWSSPDDAADPESDGPPTY